MADVSGALQASRLYDAFGNLAVATGSPNSGPFGFAGASGYQEDNDSGLKLLGHRYYDASAGRFLTRDPWRDQFFDRLPLTGCTWSLAGPIAQQGRLSGLSF